MFVLKKREEKASRSEKKAVDVSQDKPSVQKLYC
jgi:hypothetical protein